MSTIRDRPTFNDPELQRALEETAPIFEGYLQRLDGLSEDIKNAEAYLKASGLRGKVKVNRGPFSLSWNHPDLPGRIVYQETHFTQPRPFIECQIKVRIYMRGCLAPLLKACAEQVEREACDAEST